MSQPTQQDRITLCIPALCVSEVAEEVFNNVAAQIAGAVATELTIFVDPANPPLQRPEYKELFMAVCLQVKQSVT